jgi:hypothetical protein
LLDKPLVIMLKKLVPTAAAADTGIAKCKELDLLQYYWCRWFRCGIGGGSVGEWYFSLKLNIEEIKET